MIYLDDCLDAVVKFMETPAEKLSLRTYNVAAISFTPEELVEEMRRFYPDMIVEYNPDPKKQSIG